MRCVQLFQKAAACVAVFVFVAGQVQAAVITFDLAWSGVSFGNSASAVGTISLDDSLLPNPGRIFEPLTPTVTALSIGRSYKIILSMQRELALEVRLLSSGCD